MRILSSIGPGHCRDIVVLLVVTFFLKTKDFTVY